MPDVGSNGQTLQRTPTQALHVRALGKTAIPLLVAGAVLTATATGPALVDLYVIEAATGMEATIGFTSTQLIMIVGGLLTAVTGALSLMFRQLLSAQQKVFDAQLDANKQSQVASALALSLKDETIASMRERLSQRDATVKEKDEHIRELNLNAKDQSDRMLALLEGTIQGTREVLLQVKETIADNSIAVSSVSDSLRSHTASSDTLLTNLTQAISRIQDAWGTARTAPNPSTPTHNATA